MSLEKQVVTNDIISAGRHSEPMNGENSVSMDDVSTTTTRKAAFDLTRFIPYRLAVLADDVSDTIAQVYVDRFDLNRDQWRILAWLGNHREMQAKEISRIAGLDKMQMSRALARLEEKKLVSIKPDTQDRRGNVLQLTKQGRALYEKITPLAAAREAYLLAALTPEEITSLDAIITKLRQQAISLKARG